VKQDTIFLFFVRHREGIITVFKTFYILLSLLIVFSTIAVYQKLSVMNILLDFSAIAGQIAIVLYILTIIPGMLRRFRIQNKTVAVLMIYRRHIGILSFFPMLYHFMMERGVYILLAGFPKVLAMPEFFGAAAFFGIFLLTVTSNDMSTKRLGIWWGRIHRLTHGIVWLLFLHVALHGSNIWAVVLGVFGCMQLASFIYAKIKRF
jgi:DMSO/TMAO reductase YedYZ heme-binding membrane subunit